MNIYVSGITCCIRFLVKDETRITEVIRDPQRGRVRFCLELLYPFILRGPEGVTALHGESVPSVGGCESCSPEFLRPGGTDVSGGASSALVARAAVLCVCRRRVSSTWSPLAACQQPASPGVATRSVSRRR